MSENAEESYGSTTIRSIDTAASICNPLSICQEIRWSNQTIKSLLKCSNRHGNNGGRIYADSNGAIMTFIGERWKISGDLALNLRRELPLFRRSDKNGFTRARPWNNIYIFSLMNGIANFYTIFSANFYAKCRRFVGASTRVSHSRTKFFPKHDERVRSGLG